MMASTTHQMKEQADAKSMTYARFSYVVSQPHSLFEKLLIALS